MSIIQNFESTTGLSIIEAYHKIVKVQVDYLNNIATFFVAIYVSAEDRNANRTPLYIRKMVITPVDDMLKIREKLYSYMKTTNDYQEAVDA